MLDARLAFTFRPRRALPLGARWQCNMSGEVLVQMPPEPGQQWGGISRTCQPFLIAFVKYSMTSRSLWDSMAETFSSQINFLRYSIRSEVQHKNTKHMHLIYMYEKRVSGYTCQYCVSWSPFDVRIRGLPIAALSSHNRHTWDTSPVRPSSKPSWAPARLTPSQFAGMNGFDGDRTEQPGLTGEPPGKTIKVFREGASFESRHISMDWCRICQPIQDTVLDHRSAGGIHLYLGAMSRVDV